MNIAKITTICLLMTVAITVTAQTKKTSMQDARKEALERAMKARKGESICLLYTSPSPRDGLLSRMPSSA